MKQISALILTLILSLPALAREAVLDRAGILDASTKHQVQQLSDELQRNAGKDLLVVTVPKVDGKAEDDARRIFSEQNLDGVLIYIAPTEHQLGILPGRHTQDALPRSVTSPIREHMRARFRANDYAGGVLTGAREVSQAVQRAPRASAAPTTSRGPTETAERGSSWNWLPILLLIGGGFLVFRLFSRAVRNQYPQTATAGGYGGAQPWGYAPSGGGFWQGMLGGVGGALLGNTIYDRLWGHDRGGSNYTAPAPASDWSASDSGVAGSGDFSGFDSGGGGDFGGGSGGDSW